MNEKQIRRAAHNRIHKTLREDRNALFHHAHKMMVDYHDIYCYYRETANGKACKDVFRVYKELLYWCEIVHTFLERYDANRRAKALDV